MGQCEGGRAVRKDVKVAGQPLQETYPEDIVGSQKVLTYAQVSSLSSSGGRSSNLKQRNGHSMDRHMKVGSKRPRSPCDGACRRCFQTSH